MHKFPKRPAYSVMCKGPAWSPPEAFLEDWRGGVQPDSRKWCWILPPRGAVQGVRPTAELNPTGTRKPANHPSPPKIRPRVHFLGLLLIPSGGGLLFGSSLRNSTEKKPSPLEGPKIGPKSATFGDEQQNISKKSNFDMQHGQKNRKCQKNHPF